MEHRFENFFLKVDQKYGFRRFFLVSIIACTLFIIILTSVIGYMYKHQVINYTAVLMSDNIDAMSLNISAMFSNLGIDIDTIFIDNNRIKYDNSLLSEENVNDILFNIISSDGFMHYFLYDSVTHHYFVGGNNVDDMSVAIFDYAIDNVTFLKESYGIFNIEDNRYFILCRNVCSHIYLYSYLPYDSIRNITVGIISVTVIAIVLLYILLIMVAVLVIQLERYFKDLFAARAVAEDAVRANEAKAEFLSNMSHEIRTPINTILGMNEMIFRTSTDRDIIDYAENIESSGRNLLYLVNDILDFSRIEAGKFSIVDGDYYLSDLLRDTIHIFNAKAVNKNLEFKYEINSDIPNRLCGDKLRVQQILTNILSNAIKYTNEGYIKLEVSALNIVDSSIDLCVIVSDTGKGIKEKDIPILFNKFERLDMQSNNTIEGTGLGLAITKALVTSMHGEISVDSVYGQGSVFKLWIKQGIIENTPIGQFELDIGPRKEHEYHKSFAAPDARILVVDDTDLNLIVIKHLLSDTMIEIDTASSGEECIEKVRDVRYDLIFLDARMPNMDGVETLSVLRSDNLIGGIPVIVLTANAVEGAREQYLEAGFDDYLSKPVEYTVLEDTLKKYLPADKVIENDNVSDDEQVDDSIPAWLFKIPAINVQEGLKYCGSVENLLDTIKRYAESADENAAVIKESASTCDWRIYTIRVHSLKSSSQAIGAMHLYESFKALEAAGDMQDIVYISTNTGTIMNDYVSLCEKLSAHNDEEDEKKGVVIDEDHIKGIYRHIQEYVDEFNDEALTSMLGALSRYDFPGEEQNRFNKLLAAFKKMDWVMMNDILSDALKSG